MSESTEIIVGQTISRLRKEKGLSLRELSELCGLSTTAISKIERGENSPTVGSLHQLAFALEVPITDFFRQEFHQHFVFVKSSQAAQLRTGGITIESLGAGLPFQQLEPLKLTILHGDENRSEMVTHSGEEFVYCLKGKVEYRVGDEVFVMEPGDRLLFKASHPHCCCALGSEDAEILLVLEADQNQPGPHVN